MTRKDYMLITELLKDWYLEVRETQDDYRFATSLIIRMGSKLNLDNPAFDIVMFYKNIGIADD